LKGRKKFLNNELRVFSYVIYFRFNHYTRAQASRKEVFKDAEKGEEGSDILSGCH
jgi:hypothetical protein